MAPLFSSPKPKNGMSRAQNTGCRQTQHFWEVSPEPQTLVTCAKHSLYRPPNNRARVLICAYSMGPEYGPLPPSKDSEVWHVAALRMQLEVFRSLGPGPVAGINARKCQDSDGGLVQEDGQEWRRQGVSRRALARERQVKGGKGDLKPYGQVRKGSNTSVSLTSL